MKTFPTSSTRKIVLAGNKSFEITRDLEGKEWWLSIVERGHNYFTKTAFSRKAAKWLLSILSRAQRKRKITQATKIDDFAFYLGQTHSNPGGKFIRVARHAKSEGGKISFLCIPEGDSIYGWKCFAEVLHELIKSATILKSSYVQTHKNLEIPVTQEHKNTSQTQIPSKDSKAQVPSNNLAASFGDWRCAMVLDVGIRDPDWCLMAEMLSLLLKTKHIRLFPFEGSKAIWFADSVDDCKALCKQGSFEFDVGWEVSIARWSPATNTSIYVERGPTPLWFRGIPFQLRKQETIDLLVKACGGVSFFPNFDLLFTSLCDFPAVVKEGVANIPRFIPLTFEDSTLWIEVVISSESFVKHTPEKSGQVKTLENKDVPVRTEEGWQRVGGKKINNSKIETQAVLRKGSGSLSTTHVVDKEFEPVGTKVWSADTRKIWKDFSTTLQKSSRPQEAPLVGKKKKSQKRRKRKKATTVVTPNFKDVKRECGPVKKVWVPKGLYCTLVPHGSVKDLSLEVLQINRVKYDSQTTHKYFDPLTVDFLDDHSSHADQSSILKEQTDIEIFRGASTSDGPNQPNLKVGPVFCPTNLFVELQITDPPDEAERLMDLGRQLGLSYCGNTYNTRAFFLETVDEQLLLEEDLDNLIDYSDLDDLATHASVGEEETEVNNSLCDVGINEAEIVD